MTEDLRTLLRERADLPDFAPVDVSTLTQDGARIVRRRRWTVAAASAAAVVAVAGLAFAVRPDTDAGPPLDTPPGADTLTWASGGVLHTSSGDIATGLDIDVFVQTEAGYVIADGSELFAVVEGEPSSLGTVASRVPGAVPHLVGDTDGTLAAWRDGSSYQVRDLATGQQFSFVATYSDAEVMAVDGRTLYVDEPSERVAIDVDSATRTELEGDPVAFEDGVMVTQDDRGFLVDGRRLGTFVQGSVRGFSPDARWLVVNVDQISQGLGTTYVYDVATGDRVSLEVADPYKQILGWSDAHTLVVIARSDGRFQLLSCRVPDLRCEVAVPDLGRSSEFRMPTMP